MQKRLFILRTIFIACIACGCSPHGKGDQIYPVPLAGLLLNSDIPLGAKVSVVGFLGGENLYLSKDHAQIRDYSSSITVQDKTKNADIYQSDCVGNYVKVIATLEREESHMLILTNVSEIKFADGRNTCYELLE